MAAEALEKAGEKLGYPLKAETNGSGGAKNILTKKKLKNVTVSSSLPIKMLKWHDLTVSM